MMAAMTDPSTKTPQQLLDMLVERQGSVVSADACFAEELAAAQAEGRFASNGGNGSGFVWLPRGTALASDLPDFVR